MPFHIEQIKFGVSQVIYLELPETSFKGLGILRQSDQNSSENSAKVEMNPDKFPEVELLTLRIRGLVGLNRVDRRYDR